MEKCLNPFKKKKCGNTNIKLYITQDKIPICHGCWDKIAEKDYEW